MITALFVANHFPPVGGGGVQRASKFARYLPEFGVRPIVLTGLGAYEDRWAPADPTMLDDVADVSVIRVDNPPPRVSSNDTRLDRVLGRRSRFYRWWIDSIVESAKSIPSDVDVILGELVPYETAFGVEELSRRLGVPWVADLQDPWALDEMWLYPTAVHRLADRDRMRKTLRTAAAVVMNTPEASRRLVAAFPEFRERRVISITNGFDSADFAASVQKHDDGIFRILHSGYLHTNQGVRQRRIAAFRRIAGGMPVPGIDFLTRSHVFLMQAVDEVIRDDPTLAGAIEVQLVGATTDADHAAADPYPFVRFFGYRSHAETLTMMRQAELLFLPMQDLPNGVRAGLVPGKTYEYMASGAPILAAVPDGDARDILLALGTATVCRPAAVECMAGAIRDRVIAWREGRREPVQADPAVLARFERRQLTKELAELLGEVVARVGQPGDASTARRSLDGEP